MLNPPRDCFRLLNDLVGAHFCERGSRVGDEVPACTNRALKGRRRNGNLPKIVGTHKITEWQRLKALVLDSVSSQITKRVYNMALNEFFVWFSQGPRPGFTKATVSAWRVSLEERGLGSSSITAARPTSRRRNSDDTRSHAPVEKIPWGVQQIG
jgi:hypothetical protein